MLFSVKKSLEKKFVGVKETRVDSKKYSMLRRRPCVDNATRLLRRRGHIKEPTNASIKVFQWRKFFYESK